MRNSRRFKLFNKEYAFTYLFDKTEMYELYRSGTRREYWHKIGFGFYKLHDH